eukprot:GILI01016542.1.p1 GENE.GILI01016542.1~~GILI01016542.1.p1  ORF type:complete len:193 (+),score=32.98 GILI01016542.1:74-652(+)
MKLSSQSALLLLLLSSLVFGDQASETRNFASSSSSVSSSSDASLSTASSASILASAAIHQRLMAFKQKWAPSYGDPGGRYYAALNRPYAVPVTTVSGPPLSSKVMPSHGPIWGGTRIWIKLDRPVSAGDIRSVRVKGVPCTGIHVVYGPPTELSCTTGDARGYGFYDGDGSIVVCYRFQCSSDPTLRFTYEF